MRGGHGDDGDAVPGRLRRGEAGACRGDADGGVRVGQIATRRMQATDFRFGAAIVQRKAMQQRPRPMPDGLRHRHMPVGTELRHRRAGGVGVAVQQLEQQALKIRADLDVHARRQAGLDGAHGHVVGRQEAGQDVVAVRADHQPRNRQAHAPRHPGGQHIAEIPGRHRKRDLPVRPAQRQGGGDKIGRLCRDPRPVDGVHRRKLLLHAEWRIGEHRLHQILAVVEIALDGDVAHVRRRDRGHLPALHLAGAAVRMQDDDVDPRTIREGLDGGRAGVAGGGADNGYSLVSLAQYMVEQPPEQLHRHVLERQGRAVEQLLHEQAGFQLDQRRHRGMAETGIGLPAQALERGERDRLAHEGLHHPRGQLRIGQATQRTPIGQREMRPGFGHEQPAILGQAGQQHVGKIAGRAGIGQTRSGDIASGGISHGTPITGEWAWEREKG